MTQKINDRAITKDGDQLLREHGIQSVLLDQKLYMHMVFCKDHVPPLLKYGAEFIKRGDFIVSDGVLLHSAQVKDKVLGCGDALFKRVMEPMGWYVVGYYIANGLGRPLFVFDAPYYQTIQPNGGDILIAWHGKGCVELHEYEMYPAPKEQKQKEESFLKKDI
ncbi:hypothetical protein [Acinetobacter lwoffii]|uniref:hypothetical protein n=1 Tax=Acinetobacter lwoffii TaxID=28090 RepID=UPI003F8D87F8